MTGWAIRSLWRRAVAGFVLFTLPVVTGAADEPPKTGPATEKRFPPLVLPAGFRATLFACDPLVEYPSVIALGPEPRTLFVAYDYVTGLGIEIIRRDEIRIVRDRDGDGYADESTLYADGFNSIQGLAYHGGSVFVMHAPLLTRLTDTSGDGVADERRDLVQGLGLPPEQNDNRLHCANGVVAGHDGWLYLALGDRGCDVQRPEGDRLLFQEGGILRCRPDGGDLHAFSSGLRNIYDVALDDELNVFVRDNENDGGDYMIRVYHCFHGSDHGYPYLYNERPAEAMLPLADLGRGSSAGGTSYLEPAFPAEYRESLFFCEWGRAVVRYHQQRRGASFERPQEVDFATTAPDDPYGFKPTDLVVDRDGSLLISDWGDGQRPKRGRGRIYRITYEGPEPAASTRVAVSESSTLEDLIQGLNSLSYHVRCAAQEQLERRGAATLPALQQALQQKQLSLHGRLHAVWILAHVLGDRALESLLRLARHDDEPIVRAQAVRAIADLTDPVLKSHRLEAGRGEEAVCQELSALAETADERIKLEVLVALGRLRWSAAPQWLARHWSNSDAALSHAAQQLLRRADNWPEVLNLLDNSAATEAQPALHTMALRALANQAQTSIVDGLVSRLPHETDGPTRSEYFDLLTRVHHKPAAWTYWGFRPAPRPANSVAWERTDAIAKALDGALGDVDFAVRAAIVRRMLREQVPIRLEALTHWLERDTSPDGVAAILAAFRARPAAEVRDALEGVLQSKAHSDQNRFTALTMLTHDLDAAGEERLLRLAENLDAGATLAATLRELARRPNVDVGALLVRHAASVQAEVRAAAVESLVLRPPAAAADGVVAWLSDRDLRVRRAAAKLAGKMQVRDAANQLLEYTAGADAQLQSASFDALRRLEDGRAVQQAVTALDVPEAQVAALNYLAQFGSRQHLDAVLASTERSRAADVLIAAVNALAQWRSREVVTAADRIVLGQAIAKIQGTSCLPILWQVRGPLSPGAADTVLPEVFNSASSKPSLIDWEHWMIRTIDGADGRIPLAASAAAGDQIWLAATDLEVEQAGEMEISVTTKSSLRAWLNGQQLQEETAPTTGSHRYTATLVSGANRLLWEIGPDVTDVRLRLRRKSSKAEHERLTKLALDGGGSSSERGREVFLNADKSQCVKCHRIGEQGARIGPDLAGVGSRFSRMHLIESLLEPSRTVAPSYETVVVVLANGQVLSGVKTAENESQVMLGDNQGKVIEIAKSDIDQLETQPRSTMPDGLEQRLTEREFLDLIEYLVSQKKPSTE